MIDTWIWETLPRRFLNAALAASIVVAAPALAADADLDAGKSVTLLIGFSAGGGYDIYARTLARHMAHHIPGNPRVIP